MSRRRLHGLSALAIALTLAVAGLGACTPTSGRYITFIYGPADIASQLDITYGSAPSLPSPANGNSTAPEALKLDVFKPEDGVDGRRDRPAVLLVHGGGFRGGTKSGMADLAREWARRGYVAIPVEYRLDRNNQCQTVQDGNPDPDLLEECRTAILAAQHDVQAAVRWVRSTTGPLGVDGSKIAVWGSSAGAVTAINVAYNSTDPGTSGNPGPSSRVQASAAMSGAAYDTSFIDPGDSPVIQAHNPRDQAVDYTIARTGADVAIGEGLRVDFITYNDTQPGTIHAMDMYQAHKAELDQKVTAFFYELLGLSQT